MTAVDPFHTDNEEYPPTHRNVYHDEYACEYGQEIKRDGNDVSRHERAPALRPL